MRIDDGRPKCVVICTDRDEKSQSTKASGVSSRRPSEIKLRSMATMVVAIAVAMRVAAPEDRVGAK